MAEPTIAFLAKRGLGTWSVPMPRAHLAAANEPRRR
jgi:hypothetical protein